MFLLTRLLTMRITACLSPFALLFAAAPLATAQVEWVSQSGHGDLGVTSSQYTTTGFQSESQSDSFDSPSSGDIQNGGSLSYSGSLAGWASASGYHVLQVNSSHIRFECRSSGSAGGGTPEGSGEFSVQTELEVVFRIVEPCRFLMASNSDYYDSTPPSVSLTELAGGPNLVSVQYGWGQPSYSTTLGTLPIGTYTLRADISMFGSGEYWDGGAGSESVDLDFTFTPTATTFCTGSLNSNGSTATLSATGSTIAADENFTIRVTDALPDSFGLLFYGADRAWTPFGHAVLCVGGSLHRTGDPTQADATGSNTITLDFGDEPVGFGPGAITSGSTWRFQYWYRESGFGASYQLSDGLEVEFQ